LVPAVGEDVPGEGYDLAPFEEFPSD